MAYQVLARKWRPQVFEQVLGQEHITRSLRNALLQKKIGHAFLFTGIRGTGKTTIARIFAKALCCLERTAEGNPCLKCASCLSIQDSSSFDVVEMDGASHNSVEDVRQLIEKIQYLPTKGLYKVYIIDEVHMLSTSAFNALLKTLEEPPAHVVFIFATTNPEKVIDTVLSRCQRFDVRRVSTEILIQHIEKVLAAEGFSFEHVEQLKQLSRLGGGSVRDVLSLLDQVLLYSQDAKITDDILVQALGVARTSVVNQMVEGILKGELKKVVALFRSLIAENVEVQALVNSLLDALYSIIDQIDDPEALYRSGRLERDCLAELSFAELFWIYETLGKDIQWTLKSSHPVQLTEIAIQKITLRREFLRPKHKMGASVKKEVEVTKEVLPEKIKEEGPIEKVVEASQEIKVERIKDWQHFIEYLREESPALAANIEQGNIIQPLNVSSSELSLKLGFSHSGKVFCEYLREPEVLSRLRTFLSQYFDIESERVDIELELLDEKQKEAAGFKSVQEIEVAKAEENQEKLRQGLMNNPKVQEASKLFNTVVDKVVLN